MGVGLVLLACGIALDILPHKLGKTGPSEFSGNELTGLEISRVTSGLMVVATGKDRVVEGVFREDIDASFVGQDMVIEFPVGEAGLEGCGDILQGRLQVLEDEGIGLG